MYEGLKDIYLSRKLPPGGLTSMEYWSRHDVTLNEHRDVEQSRQFIRYRRRRYIGITELMPTVGHDGKTILDYGCGPGIEAAAFALESNW
jgi:2-polyprenyl-3-methyl-5-hydroxy-6-metoxy-1,4-benzoquinol methylase